MNSNSNLTCKAFAEGVQLIYCSFNCVIVKGLTIVLNSLIVTGKR